MFSPAMQAAVSRSGRCYRAYLKLTTCDDQTLYFRSHPDVLTPPGETSTAEIIEISASSQGVDFEESRTTIGDFNFRVKDIDDTLTRFIGSIRSCSIGGTKLQYFAGYEELGCEEYHCVQTTIIDSVSFKGRGYTFQASDPSRLGRTEIFTPRCGKTVGDVYDDSARQGFFSEPKNLTRSDGQVINTNGLLLDEPSSNGDYGSIWIEHPLPDLEPGPDGKVHIVYKCEILEIEAQERQEFPRVNLPGEFIPEVIATRYRIVERRQFGSTSIEVPSNGLVIRNNSNICQSTTIRGSGPEILHQIMTGKNIDGTDSGLPSSFHAGVDLDYVKSETFSQYPELLNDELEFVNPKPGDAKAFWEEQILRWMDAFLLIDCDGRFCLTPHDEPTENDNARIINEDDIIRCSEINEDNDVVTALIFAWDKDPCSDDFLSTDSVELSDGYLETNCIRRKARTCQFEGVRTNFATGQSIKNRVCSWLSRRASPKWTMNIDLCIENGDLVPGDKIRLQTDRIRDYNDPNLSINRVFEVKNVNWDFRLGVVSIDICTRSKPASFEFYGQCVGQTNACGTDHCEGRTVLPVQNGIIPAGTTLEVPAGDYCHIGDLRIDGVLRLSTPGNLGLVIDGVLSGDGLIDTVGQGYPGGPAQTRVRSGGSFQGNGWGTNYSEGGYIVECGEDRGDINS